MSKHEKSEAAASTPARRSSDRPGLGDWWPGDWPGFALWSDLRRSLGDPHEVMKVEEFTDGDQLVVRAEMPGIDPDRDVHISVTDHTLRLEAERRQETTSEDDGTYRSEFRYGSFARTITLPVGTSEDDVKATYKDGIVEIRIPVDQARTDVKKVPVERV
jgi:HSP20 family protein